MRWVSATRTDGVPIWINLALAVSMEWVQGQDVTSIRFSAKEREDTVKETPQQLLLAAGHNPP